jgi:hypothetical protein
MMGALLPTSFKPLCLVTKNAWNHLLSFQNPVSSFLNLFLQMRVLYRSPPLEAGSKCFYHGWLSFVLIMYGSEWWSWCCRLRRRGYCVNCEEVSEVGWKIRRVLFHTHGCLQAHSEKSWKNRCSSVITMLCDMKTRCVPVAKWKPMFQGRRHQPQRMKYQLKAFNGHEGGTSSKVSHPLP